MESTAALIGRVRAGDSLAREALVARYLPLLRRWAHGRLPGHARSLIETGDLVQLTLVRALQRLDTFEPRGEGAFLAYLRHALMNQIRNEVRRSTQARAREAAVAGAAPEPSALEELVGKAVIEQYEAALLSLPPRMQEAVILSLELQLSHKQVAEAIGSPSANAARMVVSRALARLAEAMDAE
ncbi:MAG: sigma-70 family RNA polymerase sigma factor [Candidatus Eisenbacteria bacterium]|uniref:Sigma-70 family RNA polymerase sigma factor n=1 Tax=Eiseniibacteriota bacterium TaxID=2212470 RepID=A0A956SGF1_UNCEI|nr:sigma-70 family RNA polymerase sigma factor [Candidatus Eisenbacteria bacterium]